MKGDKFEALGMYIGAIGSLFIILLFFRKIFIYFSFIAMTAYFLAHLTSIRITERKLRKLKCNKR